MPNVLKLTVENPDEILNAGSYGTAALMRVQSSATEGGSYTDISGTGSTPTITVVDGTRAYTGYDPTGTSSTWYRTRFENTAATRLSDWTAAFQVSDEAAGLICSVYDAKQALGLDPDDHTEDESIIDYIRSVTRFIESYTGRWFVPRPLSGTTTYRFDVDCGSASLSIPQGIRSITTLGIASESQPDTGGTHTTATSTDYVLRPSSGSRSPGWPATRVIFRDNASGAVTYFVPGYNTVEIVGAFGFSEVPADVARIAVTLVVGLHRERGASGGDSFTINIDGSRVYERSLSSRDRATLDWYRHVVVA